MYCKCTRLVCGRVSPNKFNNFVINLIFAVLGQYFRTRYIVDIYCRYCFWLLGMTISTNQKAAIYRITCTRIRALAELYVLATLLGLIFKTVTFSSRVAPAVLTCRVSRRVALMCVQERDFRVCRRFTRRAPNRARVRVGVFHLN